MYGIEEGFRDRICPRKIFVIGSLRIKNMWVTSWWDGNFTKDKSNSNKRPLLNKMAVTNKSLPERYKAILNFLNETVILEC